MDHYLRERSFGEIETRNYIAQIGKDRYPRQPDDFSSDEIGPAVKPWRLNLVALSAQHNLYFVASEGKLLVFVPRDLRNTILGSPDLEIDLPTTNKASTCRQSIDPQQPHCVTNMKIGKLGTLEILAMTLDDGDVIAYYTHVLDHKVRCAWENNFERVAPSSLKPLLHQNVGFTAWGLAIHTQSRLIAVGSNRREIIIFALGCHEYENHDDDEGPIVKQLEAPLAMETWRKAVGPIKNWRVSDRLSPSAVGSAQNVKIRALLPPGGHNIPSLDFTSDEKGDAYSILATDINGNLWQFNLRLGTIQPLPSIGHNLDMVNRMGWGVIVIPRSMFKDTESVHEALGVGRIDTAWNTTYGLDIFQSCFDISSSVTQVRHSSPLHPYFRSCNWQNQLNNMTPRLEYEDLIDPIPTNSFFNGYFALEDFREMCFTLIRPDHPTLLSYVDWVREILNYVDANPIVMDYRIFISFHDVKEGMRTLMENSEWPLRFLQYHLSLNPQLRIVPDDPLEHLFDIYTMENKDESLYKIPRIGERFTSNNTQPISPDYCAVITCHRADITLLPPKPLEMPQTICRDILRQTVGDGPAEAFMQHDRICMSALIPDLKLVVIGTQAGRCALITPTRMPACMSDLGEVITMRLELFLPLRQHEDVDRPCYSPLLGLAVSPVWDGGKEKREKREKREGVRAGAWRLFLHYQDHTILSYELFRGGKEELMVF